MLVNIFNRHQRPVELPSACTHTHTDARFEVGLWINGFPLGDSSYKTDAQWVGAFTPYFKPRLKSFDQFLFMTIKYYYFIYDIVIVTTRLQWSEITLRRFCRQRHSEEIQQRRV